MLRRFNWRWQPEMLLVTIIAAYVFVGLAIHGCGGGGGGGGGGRPSQPPTQQSSRSIARTTARSVQRFTSFIRRVNTRLELLRSRQATCPNVSSNWDGTPPIPNPLVLTINYGNGCEEQSGEFFSGSVTLNMRDPGILEGGLLVFSSISITFNNFSDRRETVNGTLSLKHTSELNYEISYDLRYSNNQGCNEHVTFNGAIRTDLPIYNPIRSMSLSGNGNYSGPSGNFTIEMQGLLWELEDCDYPIAGTMRISGSGTTITIRYSVCGRATISINGGPPSEISLPDLEVDDPNDPCF
ncbi:MAG: hypothetical protein NZ937_08845 [Armatimonadetes bacterium]|nr:hypothetical protein [Armatimonadota bacterium]